MEVALIIGIIVIITVVIGGGGCLFYFLFIATRTKKLTWKAKVYQLGDGSIKCLDKYVLSELKPYTEDIIEKVDKKNGASHYWLQSLKKAVPVVSADCVEVWKSGKIVKVLLQEDTCTLLKTGYDKSIGEIIFRPMPHDRINMIKTEQSERKERIQDKKDILSAILPYVTVGVAMVALVITVYIIVQGALQSAEQNLAGSQQLAVSLNELSNVMLIVYGYDPQDLNNTDTREIIKQPIPIPP